ncbi:MAG: metal-dependent hydrolase [Planctomycetota bacterium]|nr:metal-dependent hydrolase [Planctomycetota bacterium]
MAGYREHISVSGLLGIGYGVIATLALDFSIEQSVLAACLAWVGGMLPDLDSETGKPVQELFGIVAALAPLALMHRLVALGLGPDRVLLIAVGAYAAVRYGGASLLGRLSVHRGMFHSVPALLIASELVYLGYPTENIEVKLLMACAVGVGFLSHLLLDELYSVEWTGTRIRLNKAAGSALKFVGRNFFPNAFTYSLLFFLTYTSLVQSGVLKGPDGIDAPVLLKSVPQKSASLN